MERPDLVAFLTVDCDSQCESKNPVSEPTELGLALKCASLPERLGQTIKVWVTGWSQALAETICKGAAIDSANVVHPRCMVS